MKWAKHFVGMVTDDKFEAAAKMAKVSPLLPPVLFGALFERTIENGNGTFDGFQPQVFAAKFEVDLSDIERLLGIFARLLITEGNKLLNWAKRQGEAAVAAVRSSAATAVGTVQSAARAVTRSLSTPRVRKTRERQKASRAQLSLMLPITGDRSPIEADVSDGVSCVSSAVSDAENGRQISELPELSIEKRREESDSCFNRIGMIPVARVARLSSSPPNPCAPPAEHQRWLAQRKRDALISKLFRFIAATMSGSAKERATAGLLADEPADAQRWVDRLSGEMRACGWDDRRAAA